MANGRRLLGAVGRVVEVYLTPFIDRGRVLATL
jgi:hypothetical protein